MFGWLKRGGRGAKGRPSLDSLRFNTEGLVNPQEAQRNRVRIWQTPEGDGVGLFYFPIRPDLPARPETIDRLRASYTAQLTPAGGQIVEIAVVALRSGPAIRLIIKSPQKPSGFTYVGSLTVPFRDFSYVVKIQCMEYGVTGLREAVLLERRLKTDEALTHDAVGFLPRHWNPDDPRHDSEFPDHPVTRARRFVRTIEPSVEIDSAIQSLPGFPLPKPGPE